MNRLQSEFKVLGINHIGLAPARPEEAKHFLTEFLALGFLGEEKVPDQNIKTLLFSSSQSSGQRLEILDGRDYEDGPVQQFVKKRGGGIHHVALTVDNLRNALDWLKAHRVKMVDETPRDGAHGTKIAFIHPRATGGLLIELVQCQD